MFVTLTGVSDDFQHVRAQSLSHVGLFATPWTVTCQAPLSIEFSRQEILLHLWDPPGRNTGVGRHFLLEGNLPDPGIESASPVAPTLQADSLPSESQETAVPPPPNRSPKVHNYA